MKAAVILGLTLVAGAVSLPNHGLRRRFNGSPDTDKSNAVKDAFRTAWSGYYDNAFPDDTLRPLSNVGENDR